MSEIIREICTQEASGSIALKTENGISVNMELSLTNPIDDTDVIKLYLYPPDDSNSPINCGVAELSDGKFVLSKDIDVASCKIETGEIIRKNVFTEDTFSIAKVSFEEPLYEEEEDEEVSMDEIRRKLDYLQENPAYKAYLSAEEELKSPIQAASEALDRLQEVLARFNEEDDYKRYMDKTRTIAEKYESALHMPSEFKWYRITDFNAFSDVSSIEHILASTEAEESFSTHGHYMIGFKSEEDIICVALPVWSSSPNPISHIDDCTVYIRLPESDMEYCTVCVSFEKDGQYFMPIC